MSRATLEKNTGQLFGDLWGPYDDKLFRESVELFTQRLDIIGFDQGWFKDKRVLDAGCGGGRNTIAIASLDASQASGIDLGENGITDANFRSQHLSNTDFQVASIQDIPFKDEEFDLVWCAGVLMIVDDENRALDELTRVVKSDGGMLYLLVYANEGMRWPLIEVLRPMAKQIGQENVEKAMEAVNMPANKRRTFLDDLFCPKLDFYHWERLKRMLETRGYSKIERLGEDVRLDHEHNLEEYRVDLESLLTVFDYASDTDSADYASTKGLYQQGKTAVDSVINTIKWFEDAVASGSMTEHDAMETVIGQGHHRVIATKGK